MNRFFFPFFLLISVFSTSQIPLLAQESSPGIDTGQTRHGGLRLSPEQLTFGPAAVGDSAVAFVTVRNDSLSSLTITALWVGGSSFRVDQEVPLRVSGGGSAGIRVVYKPRRFGRAGDTLYVISDAGVGRVPLRGRSPFPVLTTDMDKVDFDSIARGTASERTLIIGNASINSLAIDSIWTRTPVFHPLVTQALVPGSDTGTIVIVFSPAFSGSFSDTLFIESNARDRIAEIPLTGMSPPPVLAVSAEEIRFGQVSITDSAVSRIRIVDASISSLNLLSVRTTGAGFSVQAGAFPPGIQGNDTISVPIVFRPRDFGEFVDTVTIESDGGLARIPLWGKSPYPILVTSVDTLTFGDIRKGTVARRVFYIKNPSINVLRLDSIYTRTKWFAVRAKKTTVRSTDSLALEAVFAPDRFRSFADTIILVGNSLNRRVEIPVSGKSPLPVPAVAVHSIELEPISFGDTCTGEFVVYNRSSINDLTIGGVKKRSPFFSMASRVPVVLGRRDSVTLRVLFTVSESAENGYGVHADTLRLDSDGGSIRVAVTGMSPYPAIASGTDELDFGSVQKGERASVPLWITNPSLNTVRIDSLGVSHRGAFTITGIEFPGFIKKGRAHSLTVAFAPDTENVYVDTLRVYSNTPGPPLKIILTGHCYSPHAAEGTGLGIPTEFCLFKNYPNPFNGTTTIKFGLPRPSTISLAVFNTLGQLVAELANGYLEAGYHTVVFSSRGLSSGLYFYRFQAGDFVDTKKLVVLR